MPGAAGGGPGPGARTFSGRAPRPRRCRYHWAVRWRARGLRRGSDLAEEVVQGAGRAAGELLDGAGHLGGVAASARAAVVLVQADKRAGEPLAQPGAEQPLAGRVVGHGGVADAAGPRRAPPGGGAG